MQVPWGGSRCCLCVCDRRRQDALRFLVEQLRSALNVLADVPQDVASARGVDSNDEQHVAFLVQGLLNVGHRQFGELVTKVSRPHFAYRSVGVGPIPKRIVIDDMAQGLLGLLGGVTNSAASIVYLPLPKRILSQPVRERKAG